MGSAQNPIEPEYVDLDCLVGGLPAMLRMPLSTAERLDANAMNTLLVTLCAIPVKPAESEAQGEPESDDLDDGRPDRPEKPGQD